MPDSTSHPDEPSRNVADDLTDAPMGAFTDEELTVVALAADPDPHIPRDAVPFTPGGDLGVGLLPEWYMPAPSLRRSTPRTVVLAGVAIALFVINVGGVCVTYGIPDPVWK